MLRDFEKQLKQEYHLPMMKAKMLFKDCENYDEALSVLAATKEGWCWNLLDYRDSDELIQLRKRYNTEERLVYTHWKLWSENNNIAPYGVWKKRYLKGLI